MRRLVYIIWVSSLFLIACSRGDNKNSIDRMIAQKDVKGLKEKQLELQTQYNQLAEKLTEINNALVQLDDRKEYPLVTLFEVKDTVFVHNIEVQGSVDTKNNTLLFSEYSGTLAGIYVQKGQHVQKGEMIAKVDDGGLSQKLEQAQVQYDLAKTTYERQARLWEKKIGSEIQYLQVKANMESAKRIVNQTQSQLNKTIIRAPFSGIIDDIPAKKGMMVAPGQMPIARLVNLNDMYVRADLSENYLGKIKVGTLVQIIFPALNTQQISKVRQVGNFINPNNRTFYIEVGVENKGQTIKPNLMATLKMADYENKDALIVPEHLVREDSHGNSYIYGLKEEGAKKIAYKVPIKKGLTQGAFVEVLEGVKAGMLIIDEGTQGMQEGMEVKIKEGNK